MKERWKQTERFQVDGRRKENKQGEGRKRGRGEEEKITREKREVFEIRRAERRKGKGSGGKRGGGGRGGKVMGNHTSLMADFTLQREEGLILEVLPFSSSQIPSSLCIWYPPKCQRSFLTGHHSCLEVRPLWFSTSKSHMLCILKR